MPRKPGTPRNRKRTPKVGEVDTRTAGEATASVSDAIAANDVPVDTRSATEANALDTAGITRTNDAPVDTRSATDIDRAGVS